MSALAWAKLGDITSDQFRALASIARELGLDVRLSNRQNVAFRGLSESQLPTLFARLRPSAWRSPAPSSAAASSPGRRHVQPGRRPVPRPAPTPSVPRWTRPAWPRWAASAPTSIRAPAATPRGRHRLLGAERRANGQSTGLPDAARRLHRPEPDDLRREGAAPAGTQRPRGHRGSCGASPTSARRARRSRVARPVRRRGRRREGAQGARPLPAPPTRPPSTTWTLARPVRTSPRSATPSAPPDPPVPTKGQFVAARRPASSTQPIAHERSPPHERRHPGHRPAGPARPPRRRTTSPTSSWPSSASSSNASPRARSSSGRSTTSRRTWRSPRR